MPVVSQSAKQSYHTRTFVPRGIECKSRPNIVEGTHEGTDSTVKRCS